MGKKDRRFKTIILHDPQEMNEVLKNAERCTKIVNHGVKNFRVASQIELTDSRMSIFTQWGNVRSTAMIEYQFWFDGTERYVGDPAQCYKELLNTNKTYDKFKKIEDMDDYIKSRMTYDETNDKYIDSAKPLLMKFYDGSFEGKIWDYDLNSAYAWGAMQDQPDTRGEYLKDCIVPDGYIGFLLDNDLTKVPVGGYADVAFPAMESPFKKYMLKWYDRKKNAATKEEKMEAKQHLLIPIGFFQKTQPFIRANIVHSINNYVAGLVDEHTIFVNTDSIYSTVPRDDLPMGLEIGEWKLEKSCTARMRGFNIQYLDEDGNSSEVKYRGVNKARFDEDYNLLTDKLPTLKNLYRYDAENNIIVEENADER